MFIYTLIKKDQIYLNNKYIIIFKKKFFFIKVIL